MDETQKLIDAITKGIQEKKGKNIVIADLNDIQDTICRYLIICQGNSPTQVAAITDSIRETALKATRIKPTSIDGLSNAEWVAMDYSDVVAHIFMPASREFYDLEHLWEDARLTKIEDID